MHINKNFRKLVLFLAITFFGSLSLFGQISHSLSLTGKTLETQTITGENGNVYSKITLGDLTNNRQIAAPELPVKYIKLIIPNDQKPVSFTVSPGASQLVNLSSPIYPVQLDDNPWDKEPKPSFVSTDKELYASTSPYPQTMVRLVNDGFIDGSNHIITLEIMPFQYYASANKLLYYNSLNITVNTVSHSYNVIITTVRLLKYSSAVIV